MIPRKAVEQMADVMMGACGIDCEPCEIRRAPFDEAAALTVVSWYRKNGWLKPDEGLQEAMQKKMFCCGCHGSRATHWSPDCWILSCCVDVHGFNNCSECPEFPCGRLVEWSMQDESYSVALSRLKEQSGRECR